jgi:hypothetical protein
VALRWVTKDGKGAKCGKINVFWKIKFGVDNKEPNGKSNFGKT